MDTFIRTLQERVLAAQSSQSPLVIQGGIPKRSTARNPSGKLSICVATPASSDYQPRELVLTVRAGTPLSEIETVKDREGQMLPFEPPHFASGATIGGTVAAGLSGPRRAYTGAVRDFVLGNTHRQR